MYRIVNENCPTNFINKFSYVSGGSRDGQNCNLYINKSTSHKNFYYLGAKCWNNLPNDLRNLPDVCTFSKAYKNRMLLSIANDPNYIPNNAYDNFYCSNMI